MSFYSYEGVSDDVLDQVHTSSTGETYTLRHNESLKIEMQYLGKSHPKTNSQGWERNSSKYFKSLYQNHPEMFSKKNAVRVKDGHAPIVDEKMISHNPEWAQYRNQPLIHHHIGGDGEVVAVPKNVHKGQGEIHNHEKAAGITDRCESFSETCENRQDCVGKTTSQLHSHFHGNQNGNSARQSRTQTGNSADNTGNSKETAAKAASREDAVRNSIQANTSASSGNGRSDSVRTAMSSRTRGVSGDRSQAVRSSLNAGNNHGSLSNASSRSASVSLAGSTGQSSGSAGQSGSASSAGNSPSGQGQGR